jgi:uncharacterized membrane protein
MERPRIKINLTTLDYLLEVVALLSVLGIIILTIVYLIIAPEIVPAHYDIYGEVTRYGNKIEIIILPIITIVFYMGLTILNKYPHIFNFPTTVTEQNAFSLYKIATRMVRWLKLLICLMFVCFVWFETRVIITQQEPKLDNIIWIFIACIAIYPIIPIVKMIKNGKK